MCEIAAVLEKDTEAVVSCFYLTHVQGGANVH